MPLLVRMDEFLRSLSGAELHVVRSGGLLAGAKGFLQRELQQFASSAPQPAVGMLTHVLCVAASDTACAGCSHRYVLREFQIAICRSNS
jgi:hypothetical protein